MGDKILLKSEVDKPAVVSLSSKNEKELQFMLDVVIKRGSFTAKDTLLCMQVMIGCCDLVNSLEKQWYGKNSKSTKISEKNQIELAIIFRFEGKTFSPSDIKTALSNSELSTNKRSLFRSTRALKNVIYLEKAQNLTLNNKRPGRPTSDASDQSNLLGKNLDRTYKESELVVFFKKYVSTLDPRYLITLQLFDCGVIERYLRLRHYILMMILKNEGVEERIKLDRALGIINDESKNAYSQEYETLIKMNKKKILSYAKEKAKKTILELDWQDSLYTTFFVAGALRYAVIMTNPWL